MAARGHGSQQGRAAVGAGHGIYRTGWQRGMAARGEAMWKHGSRQEGSMIIKQKCGM